MPELNRGLNKKLLPTTVIVAQVSKKVKNLPF